MSSLSRELIHQWCHRFTPKISQENKSQIDLKDHNRRQRCMHVVGTLTKDDAYTVTSNLNSAVSHESVFEYSP